TGQRYGPQHVRDFSVLLRPYNPDQDVNIFDYCSAVDYGDIDIIPGNIHRTYDNIVEGLSSVLEKNITPILVGGDNSITLGHLRAFAKKYGPISLVHFDSHVDTKCTNEMGPYFLVHFDSHGDTWEDYFGER